MKTEDKPTLEEMRQAFNDPDNAVWEAYFPVPPVCTARWETDDWIKTVREWKRKTA